MKPLSANTDGDDTLLAFSTDGTRIVFERSRFGPSEIFAMNDEGTRRTRLTSTPADDSAPSFSPDGSKIAFQSIRYRGVAIYTMRADGSGQTRLTDREWNVDPVWAPRP